MSNMLCSDNFKSFFNNIERIGVPLESLTELIGNELSLIAKDIRLGRMVGEFHIAPTPYNENGNVGIKEFFLSAKGYDSSEVTTRFATGDNGLVILTSYPEAGVKWDKELLDEINFLHKVLFVILGRSRLTDIIKTSLATDALTRLPNTQGFITIGNMLFNQGRLHEYSAIYLNIKNFKYVNTQIGNKHGDEVVKTYAAQLHSNIAENEYVARLGGDNFALLIKKEHTDEMLDFLADVSVKIELDSTSITLNIAARLGIYNIQPGDKMLYAMQCISTAIGNARRNPNTTTVVFTAEIMKKIEHEHALTAIFKSAVENREFITYYQPKIDLSSSSICGCEALVRWKRDGKLISPGEFIPVFERDGNICALDFYMLENACRDISQWIKSGLQPVTVSVNFSKTHLHDPDIAEKIIEVIRKYDIDAKYIEVEMTEMSDFNDYDAFKRLVTKMKENHVVTSIDDFGTGYSSLNLLTDFMFDVVKLDKSFLDNISRSHSKTDEIVVRNIVKMIGELGMKVVAEGVETVEQARFLRDIGCTIVQGYLYDKPLCLEEFMTRLERKSYEKLL